MVVRKKNIIPFMTKQLQTKLQSLIASSCYDSNARLKCGASVKKKNLLKKLLIMYIPSDVSDYDHISRVDLMLEG